MWWVSGKGNQTFPLWIPGNWGGRIRSNPGLSWENTASTDKCWWETETLWRPVFQAEEGRGGPLAHGVQGPLLPESVSACLCYSPLGHQRTHTLRPQSHFGGFVPGPLDTATPWLLTLPPHLTQKGLSRGSHTSWFPSLSEVIFWMIVEIF